MEATGQTEIELLPSTPSPPPDAQPATVALRDAVRALVREGRHDDAWEILRPHVLAGDDATTWGLARRVLEAGLERPAGCRRNVRLGLLCSYESAELAAHLRVACAAFGIALDLYAAPFGQLEQEVLGADTPLARFAPTHVLVAPTTADLAFPELSVSPEETLASELDRWRSLWQEIGARMATRILQHSFVVPDESPLGHLALRLPGARISLVRELNARLGAAAGSSVLLVDAERLAAGIGKRRWFDPRLWHAARQPISYDALPVLARETAAVLAGDVGLAPRCIVVDLDNTLWGGVVGDEGAQGVVIGQSPDGEAFAAFQDYLLALRDRGVLLAVASKNDLALAREPFERNRAMRLRLEHFDAFVADWRPKSDQVAEIAETLGLGLDSLVFLDDNPAECAEVASALPAVTTVPLTVPPSEFVRTVDRRVHLEASGSSADDGTRASSYAGRRRAEALRRETPSLPDFLRSLEMRARVRPVDVTSLERVAQLTQKTNQFNLTLVRRTPEQVERLIGRPRTICRTLELEDRFARHGIVGVAFALPDAEDAATAVLDTLLLSCRVIGRTAERHLVAHLAGAASELGYERLRGLYVPGPRNSLVADLYSKLGFVEVGASRWDLALDGTFESEYIVEAA
jgi:FkbH-like protein